MKKLITALVIIIGTIFTTSTAQAQVDAKVGGGLAYGSEIEAIGIQGDVVLGFSNSFRGAANFKYFFPDVGDFWTLNGNIHYVFTSKANATIYGLAGLNYAKQEVDFGGVIGSVDNSEVGLNLGGGVEAGVGFATLFGEIKYVLGEFDQLGLSAGLRFGL